MRSPQATTLPEGSSSRQPTPLWHVAVCFHAACLVSGLCSSAIGQVFTLPDTTATLKPEVYYGVRDDLFDLSQGTAILSATPQLFDVRHMFGIEGGPYNDRDTTIFADGGPAGAAGSVVFELPEDSLLFSMKVGFAQDGYDPRRGASRFVLEGLEGPDGDGVVLSQATFASDYFPAYSESRITVEDTFAAPFWGRFFRFTVLQQTSFFGARVVELDGFGDTAATGVAIRVPEGRLRQANAGHASLDGEGVFRKSGPGTLEMDVQNDFSGWLIVSEGAVLLSNPMATTSARISVSNGASLAISDATSASMAVLKLADSALVDLGTGSLTVATGFAAETAKAELLKGRGDSSWNSTSGITSTVAAAEIQAGIVRSVGWKSNSDGSLTVAYAAPGDTNLDGEVNVFDLVNVSGSGTYGRGNHSNWSQGDFDYNGVTNIFDMVQTNGAAVYGRGNYLPVASPSVNAVPEPSGCVLALAGLAAGAGLWRRL